MWAGGHHDPSANAQQWWPMSYNYQYQNPQADPSQDWAAKAALWAQQRMAQEQMAQYYQQQPQPPVDHSQMYQQPVYSGYQPDTQVKIGQSPPANVNNQQFLPEVQAPPMPPVEEGEPPVPGWQGEEGNHMADNIETVAMDDEVDERSGAETQEVTDHAHIEQPQEREKQVTVTQDYNHQPPPALQGMQTFDHNHGFNRPPPQQQFSHVAAQPIDYGHGHQTLDYGHQGPLVPGAQVYDYHPQYDSHYYHQHPYEMERHHHRFAHEHGKPKGHPPVESIPDISGLSDVKKKALPMWIREGLEKLEKQKQKQKKQDQPDEEEPKKSSLNLSGSASSIAGYDHGKVDSPVHSPKSNDSDEEVDEEKKGEHQSSGEEDEKEAPRKSSSVKARHSRKASPPHKKAESSDEEENEKTEEEKQQELMVNIRKLLTEVLLTVTNEELKKIAQETYNEALRGPARQLQHSGGLDALRGKGGYLGLGGYGSDSGSESDQESAGERSSAYYEDRKHPSADIEEKQEIRRSRSRSFSRRVSQKDEAGSESEEEEESKRLKHHDSGSKHVKKDKRNRSPSSSVSESSSSVSAHHKSRRKKHHRRERSDSSSPKHRRRHRRHHGKKSRSRSRSPRKHSSKKKWKSESESESDTESRTSRKHKSSRHSREYSDKKHRRKRRSSSSSSHSEREGKKDRKRKA